MQKDRVRQFKTHYRSRWRGRHNSLYDRTLLKLIQTGSSLLLDCNLVYPPLPNCCVDIPGRYQNVLAVNSMRLKYQTLSQLQTHAQDLQQQLVPGGQLFFSFNYQFVNFNRLQKQFDQELQSWLRDLSAQGLTVLHNFTKTLPRTNDWGDCFFIFTKQ